MDRDPKLQGRDLAVPGQLEQLRGAAGLGLAVATDQADHDIGLRRDLPIRVFKALPARGGVGDDPVFDHVRAF